MSICRRRFIVGSTSLVFVSRFANMVAEASNIGIAPGDWRGSGKPLPLANYNNGTLIGLGDEPPAFLDQFGQLSGRTAQVLLDLDYPVKPYEYLRFKPDGDWAQWLGAGYLPIVRSKINAKGISVDWTAFASDYKDIKAEYVILNDASAPLRIRLAFPYVYSVRVDGDKIVSGDKLCAIIPPAKVLGTTSAKYNLLSPESWTSAVPHWDPYVPIKEHPGLAKAFNISRGIYLNRSVDYRIPVPESRTYFVYLGVIEDDKVPPGESILKFTVNGESKSVDLGIQGSGNPAILEFATVSEQGNINISTECDPFALSIYRDCFISGIWLLDHAVDLRELKTGSLDSQAMVHIACGQETLTDAAATVDLELSGRVSAQRFLFPYDLRISEASRVANIALSDAEAAVREHWDAFLDSGARLSVGVPHLDSLYRTSLLNIMLMRTKYPGAGADGQDLYVVKPGASTYDNFWMRDGAYIANSLGLAGYPDEAERSLRLFWQQGLKGTFASWGQQPSGCWQAPTNQWDGNGEALWGMVHHFQLTRDREWLKKAYSSVRNGAMWIRSACEQMKLTKEKGLRPAYYGLLPPGVGEAIGNGINYYHDFWAVLGLRQAVIAAEALGETADARVFSDAHDDLESNLMNSVRWAFEHTGKGKYIPAMPFKSGEAVWGSASALYPCRFLDPHDPMMSATLATINAQAEEDLYVYIPGQLWTYITADIAMCHLLRNEVDQFYRFFNGYVVHASPTNAWAEHILTDCRRGTGDMPHGWAAADYVILHRNSLVYENDGNLELCWGVQPAWLADGATISAVNAPTKFGKLSFEMRRNQGRMRATYELVGSNFPRPGKVSLHLPSLDDVKEITVNEKRFALERGRNVLTIG